MSKLASQAENELEQKIKLSPQDLEPVLGILQRRGMTKSTSKFSHRKYYDTKKLELYENPRKISLRTQYKKGDGLALGGYQQTIKFEIPANHKLHPGVILRRECEGRDRDAAARPARGLRSEAKRIVEPFRNKQLIHIFTAVIERRYFNVEAGKGRSKGLVELAFDVGHISLPCVDAQHFPFSELEIERKKGSERAMMP